MVSYAQNFEDVYLARAFRGQTAGTYVDVGAWDPVADSVTKHFYDLGWSGVNIEPIPRFHRAFLDQRPRDTTLRAVIADRRGRATLYHVATSPGLSTTQAELAARWRAQGHAVEELDVPMWTLDDVYVMAGITSVDFLKVDVEGAEYRVLLGAPWDRVRPRLVLVEATAPGSSAPAWDAWEPLLLGAGYRCVFFDGLNRYYARADDHSLDDAFRFPPNVFDGFVPYAVVRAQAEARAHADRAGAAEAHARAIHARCHYLEDCVARDARSYVGLFRCGPGTRLAFEPGGRAWGHALDGWETAPGGATISGRDAGLLVEACGDLSVCVEASSATGPSGLEISVNGLVMGAGAVPGAIRVPVPGQVWALRPVSEIRLARRGPSPRIAAIALDPGDSSSCGSA